MAQITCSIPKGTRDFLPQEMARRNYIFDTIRSVFKTFCFVPIETPALENLSTLMGKYGEEGDKLLFRVLNSGDTIFDSNFVPEVVSFVNNPPEYLQEKTKKQLFVNRFKQRIIKGESVETSSNSMVGKISFTNDEITKTLNDVLNEVIKKSQERGLRYDLTVPFARFVVQHRNDIVFPFKRCQIQPVWRADRPQKGRYREFYQCDADVIGSDSLLHELELVQMIDEVFQRLQVPVTVKINNRKILAGIANMIGAPDKLTDITVAIDKLDKIGLDNVKAELMERGLTADAIAKLQPVFDLAGTADEKLAQLEQLFAGDETGMKGVEEMRTLFGYIAKVGTKCDVELDLTLARGLNYYTGAIFEVKAKNVSIGSICGGGRYDNLTGIFGLPGVSGVGISFGADRIYDVLTELGKFPENLEQQATLLFINFGAKEMERCIAYAADLRRAGVAVEIYPDAAKMKKQMSYADAKKIPFVAFVGESELENGTVTVKNMATGEQKTVAAEELVGLINN